MSEQDRPRLRPLHEAFLLDGIPESVKVELLTQLGRRDSLPEGLALLRLREGEPVPVHQCTIRAVAYGSTAPCLVREAFVVVGFVPPTAEVPDREPVVWDEIAPWTAEDVERFERILSTNPDGRVLQARPHCGNITPTA